jgi:hypothetical protein
VATINDCLTALTDTITTATGLRCVGIVDNPPAPCCMVYPASPFDESYYSSFKRGVFELDVVVQPVIAAVALRSAQNDLNDWLSPFGDKSIAQAIYNAPTLGTAATESAAASDATMTASVSRVDDYGLVNSQDGTRYLTAKLYVHIMTRGDA